MFLACSPRAVLVLLHTPHLSSSLAPCPRPWRRCVPNPNLGTDRPRQRCCVGTFIVAQIRPSSPAHTTPSTPNPQHQPHTVAGLSRALHSACNRHPNLNLNLIPISISSDAHHTSSDKRPRCLLTLITLAYHIYIIYTSSSTL